MLASELDSSITESSVKFFAMHSFTVLVCCAELNKPFHLVYLYGGCGRVFALSELSSRCAGGWGVAVAVAVIDVLSLVVFAAEGGGVEVSD